MLWRLILVLITAPVAGWSFYNYQYMGRDTADGKKAATLIEPLMLPLFVVLVAVMYLIMGQMWKTNGVATALALTFFGLFLQISLYFAVLLCLMPLLRRRIGARACASLWILPNMMYVMTYARFDGMEPLFLLPIPGPEGQKVLAIVWVVGFVVTLLWQVVSHFRFRRNLLKNARPAGDAEIENIYRRERNRCEKNYNIPLYISDEIQTPVTIGCFRSTAVMALPQKEYTEAELTLIFRHEFEHIQRADMRTKVFLGFCAAMCWFNPLMWIARRKASEDLELSCDEEVLKGADEATRRQYAELLLRTAGDSRGFSTCLSAGANSMRYRLKNVVTPTPRTSGTLCVVIAVAALLMSVRTFAFAEPADTVEELIFSRYPQGTVINQISVGSFEEGSRGIRSIHAWQEEELMEYIGSLRVRRVYSNEFDDYEMSKDRSLHLDMDTVLLEEYGEVQSGLEVWNYLIVYDNVLKANIPYDGNGNAIPFLLVDEVDWDRVASLLDFHAKAPQPYQGLAKGIQAEFSGAELKKPIRLDLPGVLLSWNKNGKEAAFGGEGLLDDPGGLFGYQNLSEVKLIFPMEPVEYEVLVNNWEETWGYSVTGDQLEEHVLPLASYNAHYIVYATFSPAENVFYRLAYLFDIKLASE